MGLRVSAGMIASTAEDAAMIGMLVAMIMIVLEYASVLTTGLWRKHLARSRIKQYAVAVALGVFPGCAGAFAAVAMYSHGFLGPGAVVAALVATCGDEAFFMLAMMPGRGVLLMAGLAVVGLAVGALVDGLGLGRGSSSRSGCGGIDVHAGSERGWPSFRVFAREWREGLVIRTGIVVFLVLFLTTAGLEWAGHSRWPFLRWVVSGVTVATMFVVIVSSNHFVHEHLWGHVVRRHFVGIAVWTFLALLLARLLTGDVHFAGALTSEKWLVLMVACLIGVIPESGPHMAFVALYVQGAIPFSVVLANSIVQDGHGTLPLLAHSRRAFAEVKLIKLAAGLLVGAGAMAAGF